MKPCDRTHAQIHPGVRVVGVYCSYYYTGSRRIIGKYVCFRCGQLPNGMPNVFRSGRNS